MSYNADIGRFSSQIFTRHLRGLTMTTLGNLTDQYGIGQPPYKQPPSQYNWRIHILLFTNKVVMGENCSQKSRLFIKPSPENSQKIRRNRALRAWALCLTHGSFIHCTFLAFQVFVNGIDTVSMHKRTLDATHIYALMIIFYLLSFEIRNQLSLGIEI